MAVRAADECPNLHTANLRARYSQCGIWGGTWADIWSQALRLRLLAPANSAHLRSLWSVAVQLLGQGQAADKSWSWDEMLTWKHPHSFLSWIAQSHFWATQSLEGHFSRNITWLYCALGRGWHLILRILDVKLFGQRVFQWFAARYDETCVSCKKWFAANFFWGVFFVAKNKGRLPKITFGACFIIFFSFAAKSLICCRFHHIWRQITETPSVWS